MHFQAIMDSGRKSQNLRLTLLRIAITDE